MSTRLLIHLDVAMPDELTRCLAAGGETHAVHHVIEATLECREKVVARDAGQRAHLLEGVPELLLAHPVDALDLLLLAQLLRVLRRLATARRRLAVLAGRIRTTLDRALLGEALRAPSGTAWFLRGGTAGSSAPVYRPMAQTLRRFGRTAAVVRNRRHVLDRLDLQPRRGERLDGRLAARARTLHAHVHSLHTEP